MKTFTLPDYGLFCMFFDVTSGESNMLAMFFYSILTPQCVSEIEKKKSNIATFHSFFDVTTGESNVFTLVFFSLLKHLNVLWK